MKNVFVNGIKILSGPVQFLLLLCAPAMWAQGFSITVTPTNETCPGNGALSFTPSNAAPGAVTYKVYLLPNTTTPISNNTNTSLTGLQDGTYLVVASQAGSSITAQQQVTIADQTIPLVYGFSGVPSYCNDGSITANVTSGNPVSYEITDGPVTAPAQSGNTFSNLPEGLYTIKVTDNCGTAIVQAYNLGTTAPQLQLMPGVLGNQLPDCGHVTITSELICVNFQSPTTVVHYPFTVTYTIHPPNGAPSYTLTQTVASGFPDRALASVTVDNYYGQVFTYDVVFTDDCGRQFTSNNSTMVQFGVTPSVSDLDCGDKRLVLTPILFVPPVNLDFASVPNGFNPTLNPSYPNFSGAMIFGDEDNPIPAGPYTFTATDACGRSVTQTYNYIPPLPPEPAATAINDDCATNLGTVNISIPDREIVIALMTDESGQTTDVSVFYDTAQEALIVQGLAPGTYIFQLTDECGRIYDPLTVVVPNFTSGIISTQPRVDCQEGYGTIQISQSQHQVVTVMMTIAPPNSGFATPLDVSANINSAGNFTMDGLIAGTYNFTVTTTCQTDVKIVNIPGYSTTLNDIEMIPHCGSFDISLFHTSTGAGMAFWLQRELAPGFWGHPGTEAIFEGTYNTTTAVLVPNNTITPTLLYPEGHYRIVKTHMAFQSAEVAAKTCEEQVYEFDYIDGIREVEVQSLTCSGISGDVQVSAIGVQPLTYTLEDANGQVIATNGTNNVFLGLNSATYTVYVSDPCGNTVPYSFNVAEIPSLVMAYPAPDIPLCDAGGDGEEIFDLSQQDSYILNDQDTADVTLTYHASYNDADLNLSPLPLSYPSGEATIYARVQYNTNATCYTLTQFELILNENGELQMQDTYTVCQGSEVTLVADYGYIHYEWSNGVIGQEITVSDAGEYSVTATSAQGCVASKTVEVFTTALPVISQIDIQDWTDANNVITVLTESTTASLENFEYSLDGIHYQESNVFTELEPGEYTVFVRDLYGCGIDADKTFLLTYPRFFTPNKDGVNEHWRINLSARAEPGLTVYIYDRYGKLITGFAANSLGWDGTLAGQDLPSTDYWFVVKRQNGKEYRGHFAMIR